VSISEVDPPSAIKALNNDVMSVVIKPTFVRRFMLPFLFVILLQVLVCAEYQAAGVYFVAKINHAKIEYNVMGEYFQNLFASGTLVQKFPKR
jgi:hypothetical protein